LILARTPQFKDDYEAVRKSGKDISKLDNILLRLQSGDNNFGSEYKVYPMDCGWMKNYFTLYLEPTWALIYKMDMKKGEVILIRTGQPKDIQY
jgi:mRNA-degrading endonuclease YafQ of YafQ-DinJ toxin-antitoxin module